MYSRKRIKQLPNATKEYQCSKRKFKHVHLRKFVITGTSVKSPNFPATTRSHHGGARSKVERTNYQNIPQTHILPQTTKPWMEKKKKKLREIAGKKKTKKTVWN